MRDVNSLVLNFLVRQEAEELHKRAIKIKSDLLGSYDYEVGLSIGHLASLYSYHMKKYREAEQLYLKSIAISKYHSHIDAKLIHSYVNRKKKIETKNLLAFMWTKIIWPSCCSTSYKIVHQSVRSSLIRY